MTKSYADFYYFHIERNLEISILHSARPIKSDRIQNIFIFLITLHEGRYYYDLMFCRILVSYIVISVARKFLAVFSLPIDTCLLRMRGQSMVGRDCYAQNKALDKTICLAVLRVVL